MPDPIADLERRLLADAGRPLLTYRGLEDASRVDLSAKTVANWADKVQWALEDAGVEPGDEVSLPVLAERPTHWGPLVFLLGTWQRGAIPTLGPADVVVAFPDGGGDLTCPVHPLGLGTDVLTHPDLHHREPLADVALRTPHGDLRWADVDVEPCAVRALVAAGDVWATVLSALVAPLAGGGSTVLLDGLATPEVAARIADEEHCLTFG